MPLLLALTAVGTLLAPPVTNSVGRQVEARADVGAVRTTDHPDAFVSLQRRLAVRSLADPTPHALSQFWFGCHPGLSAA